MCCIVPNNVYLCVIKVIKDKKTFKNYKNLIMKATASNLFKQISKPEIESLTQQVNETVAFGVTQNKPKIFSAAELWNIQRQRKSRIQRRYL